MNRIEQIYEIIEDAISFGVLHPDFKKYHEIIEAKIKEVSQEIDNLYSTIPDKLCKCPNCGIWHKTVTSLPPTIPLTELHKKLTIWVATYKDFAECHALAETPEESADYLITLFQASHWRLKVEIRELKKEIRELKETSFICPDCKVEKPKYLQSESGKCYECNNTRLKEELRELKDELYDIKLDSRSE
jgi:rubredoxin